MKVAGNNIPGPLVYRLGLIIFKCLFIRREPSPMTHIFFIQRRIRIFLLNDNASRGNPGINKQRTPLFLMFHCIFKRNIIFRMLHAQYLPKQRQPERRRIPIFLHILRPLLCKASGFFLLFCCYLCHFLSPCIILSACTIPGSAFFISHILPVYDRGGQS